MKRLMLTLFNEKGEKETFRGAPQIAAKKLAVQSTLEGEEFYLVGKMRGFLIKILEFKTKKVSKEELPKMLNAALEASNCLVCPVADRCLTNPFNREVVAVHICL